MKAVFLKVKGAFTNIKTYWHQAPKGYSIPYKEYFKFSVGGIGIYAVTLVIGYFTLANALYIGVALNISPSTMTTITIVNTIILFLRGPIISAIVDNTKSKYGKFRPHLIWLPIPILLLTIAIGWIPYLSINVLHNEKLMLATYIIIFNLLSFVVAIYTLAFSTLPQVMSESPSEREKLISVGSFVYSLGPSVFNLIVPAVANILFGLKGLDLANGKIDYAVAGYNRIGTYQYLMPIAIAICLAIGYICAIGTKERMIIAKNKVLKVKFLNGVKLTFKNKYFWIYSIAQSFLLLRLAASGILGAWTATYIIKGPATLGIVNTVLGPASIPGMIFAPLLIKKFGKRKIQVWTNALVAIFSVISIFVIIKPATPYAYSAIQGYLIILIAFITILITSPQIVVLPAMTCQMYDFQQYKTGDRLEGFLSQFSASIVALFTLFVTYITNNLILEQKAGIKNDYSVLANAQIFKTVVISYLIISAVGGLLMAVSYSFWNLSEKKHYTIIDVLKARKLESDGKITKEELKLMEEDIEKGDSTILSKYEIE